MKRSKIHLTLLALKQAHDAAELAGEFDLASDFRQTAKWHLARADAEMAENGHDVAYLVECGAHPIPDDLREWAAAV